MMPTWLAKAVPITARTQSGCWPQNLLPARSTLIFLPQILLAIHLPCDRTMQFEQPV
jgi:hypothetical protein